MTELPIHKRKFHVFLSHAHADNTFVDGLHSWLSEVAGISTWYDARHLPAGATIATHLADAIAQCRAMIIVLSNASIKSGWVKEEYEAAIGQRTQLKDFRIIPVRAEDCEIPGFLQTTKWVDLSQDKKEVVTYGQFLADLYYDQVDLDFEKTRDVYVSRTWRQSESPLADRICQLLKEADFRLVGDSQDWPGVEASRLQSIISSCGALVAVLPDRGGGQTSKYMLQEIEIAQALGLACLVIVEPTVEIAEKPLQRLIRVVPSDLDSNRAARDSLGQAIEWLSDEWKRPPQPHYTFFSTNFDDQNRARNQVIRQILQRVTGVPCVVGDDIREGQIQQIITKRIAQASMVTSDISEDNLNTCIEAGIARGANARLHLVARAPRRRPPFMFRDQQVFFYSDEVELLGIMHRIAYPYRRRVLNWEL